MTSVSLELVVVLVGLIGSVVTLVGSVIQLRAVQLELESAKARNDLKTDERVEITLHDIVEKEGKLPPREDWNTMKLHAWPFTALHGWPATLANVRLALPATVDPVLVRRLKRWCNLSALSGVILAVVIATLVRRFLPRAHETAYPGFPDFQWMFLVVGVAFLLSPLLRWALNSSRLEKRRMP